MKYVLWFIRIVVGVLFIFSGLVKANDPLGLVYKMNEFFEALHITFLSHYAFTFSIMMIAFEIIAGVALLFGYAFRVFAVLLLLLNLFYTFLTGYALYTGAVKECGCFGACIKISNEATFYKDVVLSVLSIILFIYRSQVRPIFSKYVGTAFMILTLFLSVGIQWWSLEHLPFYDCLAYRVGNNLWQKMQIPPGAQPPVYQSVMIYEKDGVKKEFTQDNYPWQDTTWKFVDRKDKLIKAGTGTPEIEDFALTDYSGNDYTKQILTTPGYTFFFFVKDVTTARKDNMDRLHRLIDEAHKYNIPFYVLCSSPQDEALAWQKKMNLTGVEFLQLDGTVCKTAMRSNPGLMLLKDGTVQGKWSFRDYPKNITLNNGTLNIEK